MRLDVCVLRSGRCVRRSGCRVPRYLASRSQFRLRTMAPPGRGTSSKRGRQRSRVILLGNHRCSCEPRVQALRPGRRADARLAWGRTRRWRGARRANSSRRTGVRDARWEQCAGAPPGRSVTPRCPTADAHLPARRPERRDHRWNRGAFAAHLEGATTTSPDTVWKAQDARHRPSGAAPHSLADRVRRPGGWRQLDRM